MTLPLATRVRDRDPHDAMKRTWIGRIIEPEAGTFDLSRLDPKLIRVEWENGQRSWVVETRLDVIEEAVKTGAL